MLGGARTRGGRVSVVDVTKSFGGVTAVNSVSLDVEAGEFLTLLGPSGCGKTTLMRMIAGFEDPTSGRILIDQSDVTHAPPEARPSNMVFQRYALFPHLSVAENIAYGLVAKGMEQKEIRRRVSAALELVHMQDFASRSVRQLSGGQSQRVALARALVNEPKVLLLDEPLSALDLQLRNHMQVELRSIHRQLGTTFLFVTHDQGEALAMSTRIAVMNQGRIVQLGTPTDVYRKPATRFVAGFVGESSLIPATVKEAAPDRVLIELTGGCIVSLPRQEGMPSNSQALLMLRPEAVKIAGLGQARLSGKLRDVIFIGSVYRSLVELIDGTIVKVDGSIAPDAPAGGEVGISWPDEAAVLVEA